MKRLTLLTCALACAISSAAAHTHYLVPSNFAPAVGATVALDASFTETFFVPDIAFDHSTFSIIGPDGKTRAPDVVQPFKLRTVAEYTLPAQPGTYRFSTGPRLGAHFRSWTLNSKTESSRDADSKIPAGATITSDFQSLTLAETYVSAGAPNRAALQAYGHGLELVPVTHPNDLYVGEQFEFVVQYDGKPLPNQKVNITEAVWASDQKPQIETVTTDAHGHAVLALQKAGSWIALTRFRSPAPAGAIAPEYSNSYSLSFRVLKP